MENSHNNLQNDPFLEKVRQKLADHTMHVDPKVWDDLQKKLSVAPKPISNTPKRRYLILSFGLTALFLLLFGIGRLLNFTLPPHQEPTVSEGVSQMILPETAETSPLTSSNDTLLLDSPPLPPARIKVLSNTELHAHPVATAIHHPTSAELPDSLIHYAQNNDLAQKQASDSSTLVAESSSFNQKVKTLDESKSYLSLSENPTDWMLDMNEKSAPIVAIAALGTQMAGTSATNAFTQSLEYVNERYATLNLSNANVVPIEEFHHKEYLPPLTFAFLLRWAAHPSISLETGIQYSYLLTRMYASNWSNARAQFHLHYVGVPLNVVYSLFNQGRWSLYASTGATLEKGLWSDYYQQQHWGSALVRTHVGSKIEGWQWSLQSSIGVSYRIDSRFSLFFDPRFSYFFDNNQPNSIRTAMPFQFGLTMGVRMPF